MNTPDPGKKFVGIQISPRRLPFGLSGKQHLGVAMLWIGENRFGYTSLNNLALLHNANMIRHIAHNPQIMGDQQQSHPKDACRNQSSQF